MIALVPLAAFELVTDLPTATQTLQRVRRSATRTLEVIRRAPTGRRARRSAAHSRQDPRPLSGCEGLRARYGDAGPWVLDGLDLDLVIGQTVALVGRSGAGKSTLADVLLRFLPYQAGSVALDGIEISDLRRR